MIAAAPVAAAANLEDGLLAKISAFIATSRSAAADGITWAEFGLESSRWDSIWDPRLWANDTPTCRISS